jgi:hypothetical protein
MLRTAWLRANAPFGPCRLPTFVQYLHNTAGYIALGELPQNCHH